MPEQPTPIDAPNFTNREAPAENSHRVHTATRQVLQAILEIENAEDEVQVYEALSGVMAASPFACGMFDAGQGAIRLVNFTDRSLSSSQANVKGITIELPGSPKIFTTQAYFALDSRHPSGAFDKLLDFYSRFGYRSVVVMPIQVGQEPACLLTLGLFQAELPLDYDIYPYDCLASFTGRALERIRETQNLKSRFSNLETLTEINASISGETELFVLYQLIHNKISARLGEDLNFAVAIYHANTNEIRIPYLYESGKVTSLEPFPLGQGLTSVLIQSKKSLLLVHDIDQEARRLGARVVGKTAKSWLGVPLLLSGQSIGAIILQDTEQEGRFSEKDRTFLEAVAPQVAIAIRNAQLLDEMAVTLRKYDQEQFLLNSLLDNIPEKVYFKDFKGHYIRTSRSWLDQLPAELPMDIYGMTDLDLFPGEDGVDSHARDMEIITSGVPSIGVVEEITAENGDTVWEWTSRIPLSDAAGKTFGLLGISQNISEMKKAELLSMRRAQQLQTAAEIARDTTGTLDTAQILKNVVNLVRDRFEFYHASVFLTDSTRKFAVLREASGETGDIMKKVGHRLAIGSTSLVGQSSALGITVVVNDTQKHADYYPNPLLPDTRSEAVVPIKIGARILGALDVQSNKVDAFAPEDTHTLEILADQLAIALENANLFSKTQEQIAKQKLLRQLTTAVSSAVDLDEALEKIVANLYESLGETRVAIYMSSGQDKLEVRAFAGYRFEAKPKQAVTFREGIIGESARKRLPILQLSTVEPVEDEATAPETQSALAVPIVYLDDLFGVLYLDSSQANAFDENDRDMMGSLGDSLGVVIANIRLLLQIRNQMELQQKLFDISGVIRHSVDVETILKTTAQEIGQRLGFSEVVVELISPNGQETIDSPAEVS